VIGVGEEAPERGVEIVELLPAVSLVGVMAELPVGAGAARRPVATTRGGGGVGCRRREVMDVVVVQVEVRPRWRRQLAAGENVGLQRRDAAREWVIEQPVVHATCCWLAAARGCTCCSWVEMDRDRRR
jgi:hypothetical protein